MADDVTAVPGFGSDTRLRVMLLTEKLGNYVSLQYQIDRYGDSLSECSDPAVRDAFDQLRQRSVGPIEFERMHGAGSLLDRAHPLNLSLIRRGVIRVPDAQH